MIKQLKVNRKYFVSPDDIEKLVIKGEQIWVYRKTGYPKIYKTTDGITLFKKRLTNLFLTLNDFKVEKEI